MENLNLYNQLREVPSEAIKTIVGGKLKGFSDVNPMWRIKRMTELFGPCGIGWKYTITRQWIEAFQGEQKAFCNIDLYIKYNGEWSEAIPGTGGSTFVSKDKADDEAYKMALTDALSVAMKAIGVAADVYFDKDSTKYTSDSVSVEEAIKELSEVSSREEFVAVYKKYPQFATDNQFMAKAKEIGQKFPRK